MGKRIRDYVKYTINELERYCKSPASCVNKVNTLIRLNFPPYGLSNFRQTLLDILAEKKIGFYDANLKGIILDIRNIKVIGDVAALRFDDPAIHLHLQVDCYVFQPKVGAIVQGLVKHISEWQIGVIIYRVFSVSILLKGRVPKKVEWNSEIEFRIKQFDLENAMPFIEGELVGNMDEDEVENGETSGVNAGAKAKVRFDVKMEAGSSGYNSDGSQTKRGTNKPELKMSRKLTKSPDLFDDTSSSESEEVQPKIKSELSTISKKETKLSVKVKLPVEIKKEKHSSDDQRLSTDRNLTSDTDSDIQPGQKIKSEKLSQSNNLINIKEEMTTPKQGKKSKMKKHSTPHEFSDIQTTPQVKTENPSKNSTEPVVIDESNAANTARKRRTKTKLDDSSIKIKKEENETDYEHNSPSGSVVRPTRSVFNDTQSKTKDSGKRKRKRTDSTSDGNNSHSDLSAKKQKYSFSDALTSTLIQIDSDFEMKAETPLKKHKKKSKKHSEESDFEELPSHSKTHNQSGVDLENLSFSNDKKKIKKLKVRDRGNPSLVADNSYGNNGSFDGCLLSILDKIKAEKSV